MKDVVLLAVSSYLLKQVHLAPFLTEPPAY
jgi:hypothetical protein